MAPGSFFSVHRNFGTWNRHARYDQSLARANFPAVAFPSPPGAWVQAGTVRPLDAHLRNSPTENDHGNGKRFIRRHGKSGPYKDYPAMDLVMQAMAGIISSTGHPDQPPVKAGPAVCDFSAGIQLYAAIMTALYERERTGKGRIAEVSMQDASYAPMASNLGMPHARGAAAPSRTGNCHGGLGISPYNVYRTSDGYVVINAPGDRHFRSILDVADRNDLKDDPRFATRSARVANMLAVDKIVAAWTSQHPKDDVARKLLAASVPCAPVRELSEVIVDENMHARGSLQWFDHPELGRIVLPHSPLRFEGTPLRPLQASAALGADNRRVFRDWLGLDDTQLQALMDAGVI